MGTRADFYVGRGDKSEWLGSIAWDGYPEGISTDSGKDTILKATTEDDYRKQVSEFFSERKDVSLPSDGWPWSWDTSHTTDYAYAFDGGNVWVSCFGTGWFNAAEKETDETPDGTPEFPNMKERKNVKFGGDKSGLMIIGG